MSEDVLFSRYDLRETLIHREQELSGEVENQDRNYILNVNIDDFINYLEDKYRIHAITIHRDKAYIKESGDANVDVRYDFNRAIRDKSRPFFIRGTSVTFAVPFEGDRSLFFCQGSTFTMNPPYAEITDNEILVTYNQVDPDPTEIKADFESRMNNTERHLGFLKNDIDMFNNGLGKTAKERIEARRAKIMNDQGIVAALGYPIKEKSGMPTTYTVPDVKRKIVIRKPAATTAPFTPEPILDMANYEAILKIIADMVLVMERSPKAFQDMHEEDFRQHFLVQLNGHFEGAATGETFNYEGKTDILIRVNGKNIFIAECMFWKGEKSLLDKIDQLLGYASWRDTKTAVLVFNRNVNFSKVIEGIPETVKKHSNYKKSLEYKSETGFRFILHHKDDKNRELTLTVLGFNVPSGRSAEVSE
ncbi:MAG: hypothetical protein PHU49_00310 [Syntrophorhabdaceae bacterium]|nr:hypothetical protein [Syntrophorhabdaceae bacterium]